MEVKDANLLKTYNNSSFCYVEGMWDKLKPSDINYYKKINPYDWQLARLNDINHKYFAAIQTIAKCEERYLKEWIDYHLDLGIDHIFIYDNNNDEGLKDFLSKTLTAESLNRIEIIPWHEPMDFQQYLAVKDCISKNKHNIKWLLTIDVDEFLTLEMPLKDFLNEFSYSSQIYLSWESFNANGHLKYENKPVLERFTETFKCHDYGQGKVFFRPTRLKEWGIHSAELLKGKTVNVMHKEIVAPRSYDNIYKKAWIKHYFTKSLEEWNLKIKRGCCDNLYPRKYEEFFKANPNMKQHYDFNAQSIQVHYSSVENSKIGDKIHGKRW